MGSNKGSLMNEALGILEEEGFKLPADVVETLSSFGREQRRSETSSFSPNADGRPGSTRSGVEISRSDRNIRRWAEDEVQPPRGPDRPVYESGYDTPTSVGGHRTNVAAHRHDMSSDDTFNAGDVADGTRWPFDEGHDMKYSCGGGVSSESNSTATTVREMGRDSTRRDDGTSYRQNRVDSSSSLASSAFQMNQMNRGYYDSGTDTVGHNGAGLITHQEAEARVENMRNLNKDLEQTLAGRGNTEMERDISYDSGFSDCTKARTEGARESFHNSVDCAEQCIGQENTTNNNVVIPLSDGRLTTPLSSVPSDNHREVRKSEAMKTSAQSTTEVSSASQHETKTDVETMDEVTSTTVMGHRNSLISRQDSSSQHSQTSESTISSGTGKGSDESSPKRTRIIKKEVSQEQKSVSSKVSTADGVTSEEIKSTSSGSELNMTQDMKTSVDETGKLQTEEKRTSDTKHLLTKEDKVSKTEDRIDPVTGQKQLVTETSIDRDDTASVASTFTGQCSIEEEVDGQKIKRTVSTNKSDSSTSKNTLASKSVANNPTPHLYVTDNANFGEGSADGFNDYDRYSDDRSSVYSRQDSDASSIASSASALHERRRLKRQLETERKLLRNEESDQLYDKQSIDSMTKLKQAAQSNYDSDRSDVFSRASSSSASGYAGNNERIYQNVPNRTNYGERDYLSPGIYKGIRAPVKVDRPRSHSTDGRRRATLHGDIRLTESELRQAREDVRRSMKGRDDSFLTMSKEIDEFEKERFTIPSVLSPRFDDVLSDELWNSSDDFLFSSCFGSRFSAFTPTVRDSFFSDFGHAPIGNMNPYTTRDDLSRQSTGDVSVASADSFRAMSDSGVRSPYTRTKAAPHSFDSDSNKPRHRDRLLTSPSTGSFARERKNRLQNTKRYYSDYDTKSLDEHNSADGVGSKSFSGKLYSADDKCTSDSRRYQNINNATGDTRKGSGQSINADIIASITNNRHETAPAGKTIGNKHPVSDSRTDTGLRNDLTRDDSYNMSNGGRSSDSVMRRIASSTEASMGEVATSFEKHGRDEQGDIHSKDDPDGTKWDNRRQRIDTALSWIRSELGLLRGQDKVLMSQFQRCQESIEQLKRQRPWYEVYSDDEEEEAEAEGGKHWEDWEIEDFDRSQAHSVRKETLEPVAKDSTRKKFITTDFNINQNTHQATD